MQSSQNINVDKQKFQSIMPSDKIHHGITTNTHLFPGNKALAIGSSPSHHLLDQGETENIFLGGRLSCFDQSFNERVAEPLKVNQNITNIQQNGGSNCPMSMSNVLKPCHKSPPINKQWQNQAYGSNCSNQEDQQFFDDQNENDSHKSNSKRKSRRTLDQMNGGLTNQIQNLSGEKQQHVTNQRYSVTTQATNVTNTSSFSVNDKVTRDSIDGSSISSFNHVSFNADQAYSSQLRPNKLVIQDASLNQMTSISNKQLVPMAKAVSHNSKLSSSNNLVNSSNLTNSSLSFQKNDEQQRQAITTPVQDHSKKLIKLENCMAPPASLQRKTKSTLVNQNCLPIFQNDLCSKQSNFQGASSQTSLFENMQQHQQQVLQLPLPPPSIIPNSNCSIDQIFIDRGVKSHVLSSKQQQLFANTGSFSGQYNKRVFSQQLDQDKVSPSEGLQKRLCQTNENQNMIKCSHDNLTNIGAKFEKQINNGQKVSLNHNKTEADSSSHQDEESNQRAIVTRMIKKQQRSIDNNTFKPHLNSLSHLNADIIPDQNKEILQLLKTSISNKNKIEVAVYQDAQTTNQIGVEDQIIDINNIQQKDNSDLEPSQNNEICDRFIPCRVNQNNQSIFEISKTNTHELQLINQWCKNNQNKSNHSQEATNITNQPNASLNDRGLTNYNLQDAVSLAQSQVRMEGQDNSTDHEMTHDDETRTGGARHNDNHHQNFNESLRRSLNYEANRGQIDYHTNAQYQNIFGCQNSYDQLIHQLGKNTISNKTNLNDDIDEVEGSEGDLRAFTLDLPNQAQILPVGNGHEEKDTDLMRNISNYSNLLEQQLLMTNYNKLDSVDGTAASNLLMVNLSHSQNGIPKNKFDMKLAACQNKKELNLPESSSSGQSLLNQKNITKKSMLGGKILKYRREKSYLSYSGLLTPSIEHRENVFDYNFNCGLINCDRMFLNSNQSILGEQAKPRKIASNPYKILDAPGLCDDFYLNLVDWSAQNILAVALDSSVFVLNATTSAVQELCDVGIDNQVTSLSWSQRGGHLSVGTKNGVVQIWDVNQKKQVRSLNGHMARVSSLAWNNMTPSVIASGSKDKTILVRDLRAHNQNYMELTEHRQEVCGLRWSLHNENQLASGGNDNKLIIWSGTRDKPLEKFSDHNAAVKAINWSPLHRGLLATGGGTADQCIRFWNTINLTPLNCINTGSQVCNLVFSKTNDELVSTHGYSLNQIIVWKYPTMEKITTLTGHTFRVLYLAMNPDGSSIVTGAGDETLRFWNIFQKARSSKYGLLGSHGVVGSSNSTLFPSNLDFR